MAKASLEALLDGKVFFRIGEVAEICGLKPHVIRYWESEFALLSPPKSSTGQRVYQKQDIENLFLIKHLLYVERYSIEGARKRIQELRKEGHLSTFRKQVQGSMIGAKGAVYKLKQLLTEIQASPTWVFKF